ncbi:MAG: hypothetical protein AAGJ70_05265 [Pseudomonadota bacterium]
MIRAKTLVSIATASLFGAGITAIAMSSEHAGFEPATLSDPASGAHAPLTASRAEQALSKLPKLSQPPAPAPREVPEFIPGQIKTVLFEKLHVQPEPKAAKAENIVAPAAEQLRTVSANAELNAPAAVPADDIQGMPLPIRADAARALQATFASLDPNTSSEAERRITETPVWSGDRAGQATRARRRAGFRPRRTARRPADVKKQVRQTRYRNPFGHSVR